MARSTSPILQLAGALGCAVALTALAACASPAIGGSPASMQVADNNLNSMRFDLSSSRVSQKTKSVHPLASTWTNAQRAYADLGIPLTVKRDDIHVLGNEGMNVSHTLAKQRLSTYLDCGSGSGGPNADVYAVHMTVMTQVTPMPDNTVQIASLVTGDATSKLYGNVTATCATTGELEKEIANRINVAQ
jgi:hypothetical protein